MYVSLCEFNCIKIQTMSESASKSIYFSKNSFIAFAFNAKSFAIAILVFFIFFPSRHFSGRNAKKLFRQRFNFSYQEKVWPRSDSFIGHTKTYFRKNCSCSCHSQRVWHMKRLMHGNLHSQHPKRHKKLPEPKKWVSINVMSQNDPAGFTPNNVSQLIYFISHTVHCPRQTKHGHYFLPTIFRNIKAKKSMSVTSYPTYPKKVLVC